MSTRAKQSQPGIPKNRAPKGTEAKRLTVALLPEERTALDKLATIDSRTSSAMARIYLLRGMLADPTYQNLSAEGQI